MSTTRTATTITTISDTDVALGWGPYSPRSDREADDFYAGRCTGCDAEHDLHTDVIDGDACPIYTQWLNGWAPANWQTRTYMGVTEIRCTAWRECQGCNPR